MKKSLYFVPDPWRIRFRDWLYEHVVCPVRGHKEMHKMYDTVCSRCWIVL